MMAGSSGKLVVAAVLIYSLLAMAEESIRYGAEMTRLPAGSDIASMGDAGVVLPSRATSALWNPGASPLQQKYEISAEIADLYSGLSRQAVFSAHVPIQGGIGSSVIYMPFFSGSTPYYDSLDGTYQERIRNPALRSDGDPEGYFKNNQHYLVLTIGKLFPFHLPRVPGTGVPLPLEISAGVNFKGFLQTMNPKDVLHLGIGVNADAGLIGRIGLDYDLKKKEVCRNLILGISLRDIIPSQIMWMNSLQNYREPFKFAQYYGIAYEDLSGDLAGNWTIALALEKSQGLSYHGGVEAEFWETVSFRAGFSGKTPTLGAGFHYRQYFMDYAFRFDEIDLSFIRLTMGIVF